MRLASVGRAKDQAREAASRFPFVILCGVAAAGLAMVAIENGASQDWLRGVLSAMLGFAVFIVLGLLLEHRPGRGLAVRAAGALIPLTFYLGTSNISEQLLWQRFLHLALGLHLCVAILPFARRPPGRAFWQYNRILFLRFCTGALFTAVLFGGLSLALAALDPLFGIDLDEVIYPRLFFLLAFVVNPWYFVAGVPRDLPALDAREDYPVGLRVFAQFVLIPLVSVYLLLLTAYLVRVVVTRIWPSGWIGWLVSGVAVAGTLALLLVHPLREREDSRWVDAYGRWFWVALLPSVAMLLVAIGQRIAQYGITEPRYFLLSLALTLAGIALYFGITGSRDIRVIPAALAVVALLTFVGPLSAYGMSERSQRGRIEEVLRRHDLLRDGSAFAATTTLPFEDRRRISGALRYLLQTRGEESVQPLLLSDALTVDPKPRRWEADTRGAEILAALNIEYTTAQSESDIEQYFITGVGDDGQVIDVSGWDWLIQTELVHLGARAPGTDSVHLAESPAGRVAFRVVRGRDTLAEVNLDDALATLLRDRAFTLPNHQMPVDSMSFLVIGEAADVFVRIQHLSARRRQNVDTVDVAQARVLIRTKGDR